MLERNTVFFKDTEDLSSEAYLAVHHILDDVDYRESFSAGDSGYLVLYVLHFAGDGIDAGRLLADAAGYLRGRNEKIEIVNRAADEPPEAEVKPVAFPRYSRRSFWDDL